MYVIYDLATSATVEIRRKNSYAKTASYKTMSAAKAALTRMSKDKCIDVTDYAIADGEYYLANIEKQVTKVNMMTGKEFQESINTPHYMSPSSETYWSM
jgi:hypothetical protein